MRVEILLAGAMIATSIFSVRIIDALDENAARKRAMAQTQADVSALASPPQLAAVTQAGLSAQQGWRNEVKIAAARDQQYYVDAQINARGANFLVDTGASYVAMRESDARNAGVYTDWNDYIYPVRTANGETRAAMVTLPAVEIGDIRVENVKTFILPDDQLSINLLGMSFLSQLESVEARAGELLLRG